jgi:hypothetical protein
MLMRVTKALLHATCSVLVSFVLVLPLSVAAPVQWADGELVAVKHQHEFYYYKIIIGRDRYTGRSGHHYGVPLGAVKFAIHGSSLYMVDASGKVQKTRYVLEELLPVAPPPQ